MEDAEALAKLHAIVSGAPGEPVPQVDPEDVKAVWKLGQEVKKDHPGGGVAIGMAIFEHTCKPGAIEGGYLSHQQNRNAPYSCPGDNGASYPG
jgi:hypothetical protein